MENLSELSGYFASTLVLLTFIAKDMRLLRTAAIFSNLAFITYGTLQWLPPVLALHVVLLPLNMVRLSEVLKSDKIAGKPIAFVATPLHLYERRSQAPAGLPT
jgi:CRP/FNR family transcriptional regulator, cyclic AMP receptor protein